ncbi:MAG: hypothetical protein AAFQ44_04140 [Pseudomonadota bacterium]
MRWSSQAVDRRVPKDLFGRATVHRPLMAFGGRGMMNRIDVSAGAP